MPPTAVVRHRNAVGDMWERVVDLTLSNDYAAGGWALAPKDLGLGLNGDIISVQTLGNPGGYQFRWDEVAKKLMVFVGDNDNAGDAPGAQAANNLAGLNNLVVRVIARGKGSPG